MRNPGIVSVKTRDPGQTLSGSLRASTWNFLPGNDDLFIGGDRFTPFESKDFAVTLSGPLVKNWGLGFFFSGRFEDRIGHLKGERRFTAQDGLKVSAYQRWYRDLYQPDDTRLISLDSARTTTGALIRDSQGNPITFSSGDGRIIDMSMRRALTLAPKIVLRPASRSRLTYQLLYNQSEGQSYSHAQRFAPDFRPQNYYTAWTHIVTLKQTFGGNKVFSLQGSYKTTDSQSYAFASMTDPNIQFFGASAPVTGFSLGSTSNGEFRSTERNIYLASDFTWQINAQNELKTGVQFRNDRRIVEDLDRSWSIGIIRIRSLSTFRILRPPTMPSLTSIWRLSVSANRSWYRNWSNTRSTTVSKRLPSSLPSMPRISWKSVIGSCLRPACASSITTSEQNGLSSRVPLRIESGGTTTSRIPRRRNI